MSLDSNEPDFREHLGTAITEAFRDADIDPSGEHELRFFFLADAEPVMRTLVAELEPDGFSCDVEELEEGGFVCIAAKAMEIDVDVLDSLGRRFIGLARDSDAQFDGWDRVPTVAEMLAAGGTIGIGSIDGEDVDLEAYPYAVSVRLAESVQPTSRGERYEDPLAAALAEHALGAVTGGGSQLTGQGEIVSVRLDLQLANLDTAVTVVRRVLESAGAPVGSAIEFDDDGARVIEIGTHQSVAIYLDGTSLPDEVYEQTDVNVLAGALNAVMDGGRIGELRDYWTGPTETALYLYGPSSERLFAAAEPVLLGYPLGQNARVVIRSGANGTGTREVRIPRRG